MNDKISALLNQQINKEFYSAYLYLDMANYYDALDLDGYANYYMIQAQEERDHALLFMKYMQNNGLKVTLDGGRMHSFACPNPKYLIFARKN